MRAPVVLMVVGAAAFVASGAWFVVGLAHVAIEPPAPHGHFPAVLIGFLLSMVLLARSAALFLEGRAGLRGQRAFVPRRDG